MLSRTGEKEKGVTADLFRLSSGLALFAAAYAIINYQRLVTSILYRAAANDYESAAVSAVAFALQGLALLLGTVFLPRRLAWLLFALVTASAYVNIAYGEILDDTIDLAKMSWLFAESRQASEAAHLFAWPATIAAGKTLLAILFLCASRVLLRRPALALAARIRLTELRLWLPLSLAVVAPSLFLVAPPAAERNIYTYAAKILTAPPPPARQQVAAVPSADGQIEKIVWLIDESVSYDVFSKLLMPRLAQLHPVDFGEAAALANCSSPAHVALRSGVEVRGIGPTTDLRRMPTIWAYARKAGYRTMLIDGQVTGPPQNMMLATERVLIDDYVGAASGLRTDRRIARLINAELRTGGKQFIYAVFRGVHFQYSDHYPEGALPENSSLVDQYETAIAYSKTGLFEDLLAEVDREKVAIVYTSDHGQNVGEGVVPHCSEEPVPAEFSVPLIAFLPKDMAAIFPAKSMGGHSASQIFPTTLQWMGYDRDYAQARYDRDLRHPTARYIWFGRNVVPVNPDQPIEVSHSANFPGL